VSESPNGRRPTTGTAYTDGRDVPRPREERIELGSKIRGERRIKVDACVIGTGAGGAPVAKELAEGGMKVAMLEEGTFQARSAEIGDLLEAGFRPLVGRGLSDVRVRGAWAGIDIDPSLMTGRAMSEALMGRGILAKDTHGSTVRFAPPLVASDEDIAGLVAAVTEILAPA
jgi:ornithine--oxo-acid transaminase